MPGMTRQELRERVSLGKLASLYVLWGEEKLLLKPAAGKLIDRASGESFPEFNSARFTNDSEVEKIAAAVEALPFMAEHKCVAVSDFDPETRSSEDLERICSLMEGLPDTATLVFYYPTIDIPKKRPAKWKKFLDRAEKHGYMVDFQKMGDGDMYRMMRKGAQRQGCELPEKSFYRLMEYAGKDLNTISRELEKLCAYTLGLGRVEITPESVEELTPKSAEIKVFKMVGDLTAGRYEAAYNGLDQVLSQGEEPVSVLGAMASAYIDMYRVKTALESGLTGDAVTEYAPEYKGGGSFRLRNAERSSRRLSLRSIKKCLELLVNADMSLKGSSLDPRLVLEGLMSRLLMAVQGS